jgi:hypothetical protein
MNRFHIACFVLLVYGSCSEDISPTPYEYTKVFTGETSKTWKLKFLEQTLNGEVEETFNVSCGSDDQYTFYANAERAYKVTTGTKKCSAEEADVIDDSWSFNNASATLTMILPFFTDSSLPFVVREAKKNKLELEFFLDQENTSSYRIHLELSTEN